MNHISLPGLKTGLLLGVAVGICFHVGCQSSRPPRASGPLWDSNSRATAGRSESLAPAAGALAAEPDENVVKRVAFNPTDEAPRGGSVEVSANAASLAPLPMGLLEAGGQAFSLNQVVAWGLANDSSLAVGAQLVQMAVAEQVTAGLLPNPEVEIVQSLLPLGRPFEADVREGGPPQLDVLLSFPIDWYVFGKRAAELQTATLGRQATEYEYADLIRQRVLEISLAFYDIIEQQALLELADQDVENLREVERLTEVAVQNGALPTVELNRIRLDRLSSEQTRRETMRDLQTAKADLLALIGGLGGADDFTLVEEPFEPSRVPVPRVDDLFELAQANRPDIEALRMRVAEGRANVNLQERLARPEVTPVIGYTRQFQERAIGFPDVSSWGAGLSMTLPVFDRNQGNRLGATAEQIQRSQELQLALVELRSELMASLAEFQAARENAQSTAEEQLRLAEEVRDGIRQAYELGGRPLIDVLDSQRNFRDTYRNYISSRADYGRAVQRFNAVLSAEILQ